MIGRYLASKLKKDSRLLLIEGVQGAGNASQQKAGFLKAISAESTIKIVSIESAHWHMDEAFSLVTGLLEVHGPVDAIFCANDMMALGALQAVESQGLAGSTIITGYDNIDSVRTEMRSGRIHATVDQHPEIMGEIGVKFAIAMMNNEVVPSHHLIPIDLITYEPFGKKIIFSISSLGNSRHDFSLKTSGVVLYWSLKVYPVLLRHMKEVQALMKSWKIIQV